MKYVILALITLAVSIGGWFAIQETKSFRLGAFSDPFISLQLATDPDNGEVLGTDGTNNVWTTVAGSGDITGASNLGTGLNIFDTENSGILRFNTIAAGSNITLSTTSNANTIVIASTASGGGAEPFESNASWGALAQATTSLLAFPQALISSTTIGRATIGTLVATSSITGTLTGNASTATALAADGGNCSAGSFPLGVDTLGAVQDCTDAWTESENTSAAYTPQSRTLTVAGTANQITSSAGAQDLTANRTWTLSIPSQFNFPNTFFSGTGTSTLFASASSTIGNLTLGTLTATTSVTIKPLTSALIVTDSAGLLSEYTGIDCTNQFVRDVSAVGGGTCATITSADVDLADLTATDSTLTFSGAYDGQTARTVGINLATANTWTGLITYNAGLTGANATSTSHFYAVNEYVSSSTMGRLTVGTFVATSTEEKIFSITVASTSPYFIGGTNLPIVAYARYALELTQYRCFVQSGTSVVLGMTDGTNATETITCATTMTSDTDVATNDTFTLGELKYLDFGTVTGTVDAVTFEAYGYVRR